MAVDVAVEACVMMVNKPTPNYIYEFSNREPNLTHFCSGSIVMLCRNPTLNPGFYFDKTFEEYKKGFHANGILLILLVRCKTMLQARAGLDSKNYID